MPRGQRVDDQLCWTVMRMIAMQVAPDKIAMYTGISTRTIGNIKKRYRNVSDPCVPKRDPLMRGREKKYSEEQLQVRLVSPQYIAY
jgi:hypothetical protein